MEGEVKKTEGEILESEGPTYDQLSLRKEAIHLAADWLKNEEQWSLDSVLADAERIARFFETGSSAPPTA